MLVKDLQMEFETHNRGLDWLHAWLCAGLPRGRYTQCYSQGSSSDAATRCLRSNLSGEAESEKLKRTFALSISDGKIHAVLCRYFLSLSAFSQEGLCL